MTFLKGRLGTGFWPDVLLEEFSKSMSLEEEEKEKGLFLERGIRRQEGRGRGEERKIGEK